jgi:hypothetical protein
MQNKHITLTPFFGMCPSATSKAATSSSSVIESAVLKQTPVAADSMKAIPLEDNAAVSIGTMMLAVADTTAVARLEESTVGKVTSVAQPLLLQSQRPLTLRMTCPRKTMPHSH